MQNIFKKRIKHTIKNVIYDDDVFIVSYPKSGNTWVRFLLANLMVREDDLIDFHSSVNYIPDFEVHHEDVVNAKRPRLLKSHSTYNKKFNKVIYIVRDPRDVYVSYYNYLLKKLPSNERSISAFIKKSDLRPCSWELHVKSWLNNSPKKFLIIKYEDLIDDTKSEFIKILTFLKWEKSEDQINRAIERSSFESMSRIEDLKGRPFKSEKDAKLSTKFVRSGKVGSWKNVLSNEDEKMILNMSRSMMQQLGYL